MSAPEVYHRIRKSIEPWMDGHVDESSRERVAMLVAGILGGRSASPAEVARTLERLGLSGASAESIERRIRRLENDGEVSAAACFHPFARFHLRFGRPKQLILICDPTTLEDRFVLVSFSVWYRGRALPLAWGLWLANTPLEGEGFWERVGKLLDEVAALLPAQVPVIVVADRAFGSPAFIDQVSAHGWHYVVRVVRQTRCQDRLGREQAVSELAPRPGCRRKLSGRVFKKAGWRAASVVAYWGNRHTQPLLLVSDLPPQWEWIALYRQRYPIEAQFRDYKSHGWHWEQGQVQDLDHMQRLLVGMALATWLAVLIGAWVARQLLARTPSGKRSSLPPTGKHSLFAHGLQQLLRWLAHLPVPALHLFLDDWQAPPWRSQIRAHHLRAFVFAASTSGRLDS